MKIKEKLKNNIQRNLNQQYIRRLLGIIAIKPVLYAYGSTFSSISDRYLNIFSIESLKKAYDNQSQVGFGSLFLPYEFFYALGAVPFLPEVMAGFTASLGIVDQTIDRASSNWYSQDLCTFHRSSSGAVEMDLFPRPEFLLVTNLACDAAQKSFYIYAKKYGREKNFYHLDVPYEKTTKSIAYLAGQLKRTAADIAEKSGKKIDLENFKRVIKLSNEFRSWAIKVNEVRKSLTRYPPYYNGLNFILPFHGLAGTREAVTLYRQMYIELKNLLEEQEKRSSNGSNNGNDFKEAKKILWLHLKPYYRSEIFDLLAEGGCRVAFEEINYVYWPELDPEKPFESLANKIISHPLTGSVENRLKSIINMARDYDIDGVIMYLHWGCRQSNGSFRIIKDRLKETGIPTLAIDGDCVDQNNSQKGQVKTRMQGFIEILNSR